MTTDISFTYNGGGDSLAIALIARYAIANCGVDSTPVFAADASSGAMMNSVLMGAYPDLFVAGSLYSGIPYGCYESPTAWSPQFTEGKRVLTTKQ